MALPDGGGGPGLSGSRAAYRERCACALDDRICQRSENAGEPGGD